MDALNEREKALNEENAGSSSVNEDLEEDLEEVRAQRWTREHVWRVVFKMINFLAFSFGSSTHAASQALGI